MIDYQYGGELPVHDHGYVKLLDVMGTDEDIVDAARISYDRRGESEDRALIRYLLRHSHSTPFEMAVLKFEVKMPIFVARQWVRHRTASINEMSARYTELPAEMFVPEVAARQSSENKQGRAGKLSDGKLKFEIQSSNDESYVAYEYLLKEDVAREIARGVLPLNIYTKFIWKMDLHNLMHFLKLRLDPHAQKEIRDYAEVIERMVAVQFPMAYEAFVDYQRDAYTCSRMEIEILREMLACYNDHVEGAWGIENLAANKRMMETDAKAGATMSKRELAEFRRRFLDG